MLELDALLNLWQERLERFKAHAAVAKGLDGQIALGIHTGRTKALEYCIKELEKTIEIMNINVP